MRGNLKTTSGILMITALITLLLYPGLYAAEETLPTPEEIIAKNIEAIGGIKALKKIKNKKIVRRLKPVSMDTDVIFTSYQERPEMFYGVTDRGVTGKSWTGSDGKNVWEINPVFGPRFLEGDHLSNALNERIFDGSDGPDVRYKSMKTEGIERINGKDCYKVVKIPERGTERIVYYDKNSYMIVKIIIYNIDPRGNYIREIFYEDYQKINNILFPYRFFTFLRGQKVSESTLEKIEMNIEMPEGIFDIPEEVKAIMNK